MAQLADGLVTLPADARNREALEWVAEEVVDHGGEATIWLGSPADEAATSALIERMTAAVAADYEAVRSEASASRAADPATVRRTIARLRRELHRIAGRDFFPPLERELARRAVEDLAATSSIETRT